MTFVFFSRLSKVTHRDVEHGFCSSNPARAITLRVCESSTSRGFPEKSIYNITSQNGLRESNSGITICCSFFSCFGGASQAFLAYSSTTLNLFQGVRTMKTGRPVSRFVRCQLQITMSDLLTASFYCCIY